jgi:hypothetical protein
VKELRGLRRGSGARAMQQRRTVLLVPRAHRTRLLPRHLHLHLRLRDIELACRHSLSGKCAGDQAGAGLRCNANWPARLTPSGL